MQQYREVETYICFGLHVHVFSLLQSGYCTVGKVCVLSIHHGDLRSPVARKRRWERSAGRWELPSIFRHDVTFVCEPYSVILRQYYPSSSTRCPEKNRNLAKIILVFSHKTLLISSHETLLFNDNLLLTINYNCIMRFWDKKDNNKYSFFNCITRSKEFFVKCQRRKYVLSRKSQLIIMKRKAFAMFMRSLR